MMAAATERGTLPRLALTLGEPAGIGPDLCLQIAQQILPAEVVVVGCPDLLAQRAKLLNLPLSLHVFQPEISRSSGKGHLTIWPVPLPSRCEPSILNEANSPAVLETLRQAYQLCATQQCAALVTAPVHKAILNKVDPSFKGHTEYFAQLAGIKQVLMSFYTPNLMLGLVTTHCALHEVSALLTAERLTQTIHLFALGLQTLFKKSDPKIGICGLNPHAGENGLLGQEEQTILIPTIQALQQQGLSLGGRLPADTAFSPYSRPNYDGILAMYHDQGLAPFKALFFGEIVNVTIGLPFLRTSVDHGTALTLAGTGKADPNSLLKAITLAAQLTTPSYPYV